MSLDRIFGPFDGQPKSPDHLAKLWSILAPQNVGTPNFVPNFGLTQKRHEITMLWSLYERAKPDVVVEIGVAQGGTLAGWCILGQPEACIVAIDRDLNDCRPRPGEPVDPSIYSGGLYYTNQGGGANCLKKPAQHLYTIQGWSTDPRTIEVLYRVLGGDMIDWLWNDASHDYAGTMKDWNTYWPMISEGGVYAMHDILPSAHPDVTRSKAWQEIKSTVDYSACYEFCGSRNQDSMGIGVIIK